MGEAFSLHIFGSFVKIILALFFFPIVVLVIISAKAEVTHFAKAASLAKLSLAGRALGFVLQGAKRLT